MSKVVKQHTALAPALTPRQWNETFSAPPILSSETPYWASALLRQWSNTAPIMEHSALDHHFVALHLGGSKRVTRRGEGNAVVADVEMGGLSVTPAGSAFSWQTEGPIGFAHLYLATRMVDQVVMEEFDCDPHDVTLVATVGFDDPLLRAIFVAMLNEIRSPGAGSRLLLDSLLRTFTLKLVRDHSNIKKSPTSGRYVLAPYRLRQVLAFIEARLADDIKLGDLAALSGYSLYHFSRGFSRATGLPPYRYLLERRIERAKILLSEPLFPLGDVAVQCGFHSQRQFGTMFSKLVGISPGRFQRER